jgi:hypothetical protein
MVGGSTGVVYVPGAVQEKLEPMVIAQCTVPAHSLLHTSKQPLVTDSPKQATGLKKLEEVELVGLSPTEKPAGQVEHSRIEPKEHLTD